MPGTITFRPVEANLTHDTDWLGKMDPYCLFTIGGQKAKSQICRHGGTRPHWEDAVTIQSLGNQSVCRLDVLDKDRFRPDDSIAATEIDLTEIERLGRTSRWYPVYHRRKLAGEILVEAVYQPQGGQYIQQPIIQQQTVIPTETVVTEQVITSAPIITSTSNYTEFNQGLPLGTGQQFIGQSYEIPTSNYTNLNLGQGFPLDQGLLLNQGLPLSGQTYESTSYVNQSYELGGLGLGSQLPGGLQPGYYNSNSTPLSGSNVGTLNPNSGLVVSKTSGLGPSGGFPHGYRRLGGATNAGYGERPGYTIGNVEADPTNQSNLDSNGGGFFLKHARERRAEPYTLSNPGTYGIPHGQTIDTTGHLRPDAQITRPAPIGQINQPGYTGYPGDNNIGGRVQPGLGGYQSNLGGYQSGLGDYQSGLGGYQSNLGGLQSGLGLGQGNMYQDSLGQQDLKPTLGQRIESTLGLQPNLNQGTPYQSSLGQGLQPNLSQGFQNNLGQGYQSNLGYPGAQPTLGQKIESKLGLQPNVGYQGTQPNLGYQGTQPTLGQKIESKLGLQPNVGYQGTQPNLGYQGTQPTLGQKIESKLGLQPNLQPNLNQGGLQQGGAYGSRNNIV